MLVLLILTLALRSAYGKAASNSLRIFPGCIILDKWVFKNFILADKTFAKALQIFETCVSVNNKLRGQLVSSLENWTWWKIQSYLSYELKLIKLWIRYLYT